MSIPFLDLGRLHESIRADIDEAIDRVVRSSAFIGGKEVADFERAYADAHGCTHTVGCNSGTDAIALALVAAGIGPGDEVVVPSMTFFASAEAVFHAGATPVVADVDPETLLLTPATVSVVATKATRAVLPVHLYGHVVAFAHLEEWQQSGLVVIEDAAQAHLAMDNDRVVGSVGDAACFSFFPGKNLGALGDAGALTTDDDTIAAAARKRRDHGRTEKYIHDSIGVSSRLDGLQAALLSAKLPHLQRWTERRRALADQYRTRFKALDRNVASLVPWSPGAVHHLLVLRVRRGRRDELQRALSTGGIGVGVHYPVPLSQQPPFAGATAPCPAAEQAAREVLSLPMDPLMTDDEVDRVCDSVLAAL